MQWNSGAAFLAAAFFIVSTADGQPLDWNSPDAVVRAAIDANPSLASLGAQIRAAKERVVPAGSLPNPMVMAGVQDQQIDLSIDEMMTMYMVGASQTLVRKSRRDARRRAAELDVERLEREYESRRAEVERDARTAYVAAAAAQNQIAATEEVARLAASIVDAARIRYETGSAPQADMIRARLQESTLLHELLALRRERTVALARLLPLLNLPATTAVPPFSLRHEMERHQERGFDPTVADTPATAALEADAARAEQEIRLARLARRPDLDIEASYGLRPQQKDMFSVVARIELPFRRATLIEPRIREAIARRDAARQEIDVLRQQLRQDVAVAAALRDEATEQINLHVDRLVPEAKLGFESSLASYQNEKTTFDAVLGSLQAYRALNVDYYQFLRQQLEAEIDVDAIRRGARGRM
jgi:cobalt-zinc-cadmium efflux system outer membrane protein